jgi:ATPase subunit of ABC transporter with duplicated ATPase domains
MQFGVKPLFENISVKFRDGNRYGLIGANGSGESTFMKILDGTQTPTSGQITLDSNQRIGKLNQNQFEFEEFKVLDTVIMGHKQLWEIKKERDRIYSLPEMTENEGLKVADLEIKFGEMDGYSAESKAGELLISAGIDLKFHNLLMKEIAPGWKLRILLAQALFFDPDLLFLDEPTNNLDIHSIRWLETILKDKKSTMIIISHDRHFLNSVCTHIADIDYGEIKIYNGNYDDFMFASTQARERIKSENEKKNAQISELQHFVSRFSANASKARQATSRARQIEKIKLEDIKPSSRLNPFIRFNVNKKIYRQALLVKDLSHAFDKEVLYKGINLTIEAGEKVAIIGENGIGKSTLLKCLNNQIKPDKGHIKWSENSVIGYCPQDTENEFTTNSNLYDWLSAFRKKEQDDQTIRATLGRLLFSTEDFKKKTNVCSGGEKNRLLFGKLMLLDPNILIMDEPTNHLDMESIESLNAALENFSGTIIFVSHDREFVSTVANRIIEINNKELIDFNGTYDEYIEKKISLEKK